MILIKARSIDQATSGQVWDMQQNIDPTSALDRPLSGSSEDFFHRLEKVQEQTVIDKLKVDMF